jgi:cytochrome c6
MMHETNRKGNSELKHLQLLIKTSQFVAFTVAASTLVCAAPAMSDDAPGKSLFQRNCAACHQPNGLGVPDVFPALAGNVFVQGSEKDVIAVVLTGRNGMPTFSKQLADQDLAAILSYVRSAWGNKGGAVSAEQVAGIRSDLHAEAFDPSQQNIRH